MVFLSIPSSPLCGTIGASPLVLVTQLIGFTELRSMVGQMCRVCVLVKMCVFGCVCTASVVGQMFQQPLTLCMCVCVCVCGHDVGLGDMFDSNK